MRLTALLLTLSVFGSSVCSSPKLGVLQGDVRDVNATACSILKRPQQFNGKIVHVRANAYIGLESFTASDPNCKEGIWLDYATDANETNDDKHPNLTLVEDAALKKFKDALGAEQDDPAHPCTTMHCMRYDVTATITGRVDYRSTRCKKPAVSEKPTVFQCGYGHMGAWPVRIVIQSVTQVIAVPRN